MCRRLVLTCFALLLVAAPARASLLLSLEGLPAEYVPNSTFSFDVRLVGALGLNSFFIMLELDAAQGTAGIDFFFDEDLTLQPASGYVFDGMNPVGFEATAIVFGNTAQIALSDFLDVGEEVDTVAGVNDLIATVTVTTTRDVGTLSIGFNTDPLFFELLDDDEADIPGYDELVSALEASGPISLNPTSDTAIPEPSTLSIFVLGGGVALFASARRRRLRKQT